MTSNSIQNRQRGAAVAAALIMPLLTGVFIAPLGWNTNLILERPGQWWANPLLFLCWLLAPIGYAATFGYGVWISWRASASTEARGRLLPYSLILLPVCLSHSVLTERIGLFVHSGTLEAFDLRTTWFLLGSSMASNFYPDFLALASFLATLCLFRCLVGICLVRNSESSKHQFRISIKSILISTAFAAVTLAVVRSALESNTVVVASMELHARFWLDSSLVIEPLLTGVAAAITIYLVASAQGRSGLRWGASVVLSITALLVPETFGNFQWWFHGYAYATLLPNIYNLAGAIGTLAVCVGSVRILLCSGLEIEYSRRPRLQGLAYRSSDIELPVVSTTEKLNAVASKRPVDETGTPNRRTDSPSEEEHPS